MGKIKKRSRTIAAKSSASGITVSEVVKTNRHGTTYVTNRVQGWKEDGKWQRRDFKDIKKAQTFANSKRIELENKGANQKLVLSPLTEDEHEQARRAFDALGGVYSLDAAVSFFLKHHREPNFTIPLKDAVSHYLADKESQGLRPRTIQDAASTLRRLADYADNAEVHTITQAQVEGFLASLTRRDDPHQPASKRTRQKNRGAIDAFFNWCCQSDLRTQRPYTFENPAREVSKIPARHVREEMDETPATTNTEQVKRILSALMRWKGGRMVKAYALLYFAGIRPSELEEMNGSFADLINLKTGIITIPARVSKTRQKRQISITDNLKQWLKAYTGPIIPPNFKRNNTQLRKHFNLSHDEPRHSFISYHVALNRSVGDAALQAGNSESIVKRHYLNTHTQQEGAEFFGIVPDVANQRSRVESGNIPEAPKFRAI